MRDVPPFKMYGIIGFPLNHTFSPRLHTAAFRDLGISAALSPWPVPPEKLPVFMEAFRLLDIQGACVTIPHKQTVIPYLDALTDRARSLGAVNLIYRQEGRICGDNTDLPGFLVSLKDQPPAAGSRALLLGAGGVARAVAVGLLSLGFADITVTSPTAERSAALARAFDLKVVPWERREEAPADLVVNATPLGQQGGHEGETGYRAEWFAGRPGLAYDVVYTPAETRFLRDARAAGWRTVGGMDMFLGQAEAQFFIWTGRHLPESAKQAVLETANAAYCAGQ